MADTPMSMCVLCLRVGAITPAGGNINNIIIQTAKPEEQH